jgi:hypothetical protein
VNGFVPKPLSRKMILNCPAWTASGSESWYMVSLRNHMLPRLEFDLCLVFRWVAMASRDLSSAYLGFVIKPRLEVFVWDVMPGSSSFESGQMVSCRWFRYETLHRSTLDQHWTRMPGAVVCVSVQFDETVKALLWFPYETTSSTIACSRAGRCWWA